MVDKNTIMAKRKYREKITIMRKKKEIVMRDRSHLIFPHPPKNQRSIIKGSTFILLSIPLLIKVLFSKAQVKKTFLKHVVLSHCTGEENSIPIKKRLRINFDNYILAGCLQNYINLLYLMF